MVKTDLTGSRFGKLTVLIRETTDKHRTRWECLCDCGHRRIIRGERLKNGETTSCGCSRRGSLSSHWKGGRQSQGNYVSLYFPDHPRSNNRRVLEHILVAEKALGRFLKCSEMVHHIDGNGKNNSPSNLVICPDQSYHMLLHRRTMVLKKGGNPTTDKNCSKCKGCYLLDYFYKSKNAFDGRTHECKKCINENDRIKREAKYV